MKNHQFYLMPTLGGWKYVIYHTDGVTRTTLEVAVCEDYATAARQARNRLAEYKVDDQELEERLSCTFFNRLSDGDLFRFYGKHEVYEYRGFGWYSLAGQDTGNLMKLDPYDQEHRYVVLWKSEVGCGQ